MIEVEKEITWKGKLNLDSENVIRLLIRDYVNECIRYKSGTATRENGQVAEKTGEKIIARIQAEIGHAFKKGLEYAEFGRSK